MSIDIHVFSDKPLTSTEEWQAAVSAEKFDLYLPKGLSIGELRGFLPVRLRGADTGFECYHDDADEVMAGYQDADFGHAWGLAISFRFGGDFNALLAAWMAATAYARASGGIVLDSQEGKVFAPDEALGVIGAIENDRPVFERAIGNIEKMFVRSTEPGR